MNENMIVINKRTIFSAKNFSINFKSNTIFITKIALNTKSIVKNRKINSFLFANFLYPLTQVSFL
jgi:hypothetical protein